MTSPILQDRKHRGHGQFLHLASTLSSLRRTAGFRHQAGCIDGRRNPVLPFTWPMRRVRLPRGHGPDRHADWDGDLPASPRPPAPAAPVRRLRRRASSVMTACLTTRARVNRGGLAGRTIVAEVTGYYYGLAHFVVTSLILGWLYLRRSAAFARLRSAPVPRHHWREHRVLGLGLHFRGALAAVRPQLPGRPVSVPAAAVRVQQATAGRTRPG